MSSKSKVNVITHDPNKIIKRKFNEFPTSEAEKRNCKMLLDGTQLQKISAGPTTLEFGKVFVKSKATKSFSMHNDLSTHIWVELLIDEFEELQNTTPKTQVIPPGQMGSFEIIFCGQNTNLFKKALT